MLVEFASAVDAARCAIEVQPVLVVPEVMRLEYWIGIHVGDIIVDENNQVRRVRLLLKCNSTVEFDELRRI